jgi:hypothetical protein
MSRRNIKAKQPGATVTAGWDPPLQSFFAQVHEAAAPHEDASLVFWTGTERGQVRTVAVLAVHLAPFAELSPDDLVALAADRVVNDGAAAPLGREGDPLAAKTLAEQGGDHARAYRSLAAMDPAPRRQFVWPPA